MPTHLLHHHGSDHIFKSKQLKTGLNRFDNNYTLGNWTAAVVDKLMNTSVVYEIVYRESKLHLSPIVIKQYQITKQKHLSLLFTHAQLKYVNTCTLEMHSGFKLKLALYIYMIFSSQYKLSYIALYSIFVSGNRIWGWVWGVNILHCLPPQI